MSETNILARNGCRLAWLFCGLLALAPHFARAAETVRVEDKNGAPRILVDGQPVRARIFFGNPGSRAIPIGPVGKEVSFDFTALGSADGKGTMHWRFGDSPGDIFLDNVEVTDLDDGGKVIPRCTFEGAADSYASDWTFWPKGAANTVGAVEVKPGAGEQGSGALHITLTAPATGKWPGFHVYHQTNLTLVEGHHYRVTFWARAEPARELTIGFYRPAAQYVFLGGPETFAPQIKMAADVGVNFVSFGVTLPWSNPGTNPDWTQADAACAHVLDANPNALLIPRINLRPSKEWLDAHPDDVMVWNQYDKDDHLTADVASPVYRQEAAAELSALVTHLEEKFGPHMAGYHPAGQNTDEWFYEGTWGRPLNGYGPSDLTAWRAWLARRYANDAALQTAWHDPQATLATAAVPSPEARYAAPAGILRDPAKEQAVIDFTDFQQESMSDFVCAMAHAVREATQGKKLVLFFYGYVFEFSAVANGPGTSGHYAVRRILDCPDIDVLCSPISYFDRGLGEGAPCMTAAESIALAGKIYLREDDTFTFLGLRSQKPPGSQDAVGTVEETEEELERNVAQESLRNFATWWMDLPATGWFQDPRLWAVMGELKGLDQYMLDHPTPYAPEIAAVIDEASMRRVAAGGDKVSRVGVSDARLPLGRMGAPYGQYLQDDVAAGKVHAKLYVFLSSWHLSAGQRKQLLDATRGSARIWCYAPGYQEGDHTSLDAMQQLTGFRLKQVAGVAAWAEPTALGKQAGLSGFGAHSPLEPLFAADDATPDETLATYPDGSVAVALRQTADGLSLFVGVPGLTQELLRLVAQKSGVHLYTDSDCNVWANGPFLVLHASHAGPLTVDTGHADAVTDFLTGTQVGQGPTFGLTLKKGETRILKIH